MLVRDCSVSRSRPKRCRREIASRIPSRAGRQRDAAKSGFHYWLVLRCYSALLNSDDPADRKTQAALDELCAGIVLVDAGVGADKPKGAGNVLSCKLDCAIAGDLRFEFARL